jgi:hypothetical protein
MMLNDLITPVLYNTDYVHRHGYVRGVEINFQVFLKLGN